MKFHWAGTGRMLLAIIVLLVLSWILGTKCHPTTMPPMKAIGAKHLGKFRTTYYNRHYKWGNVTRSGAKPDSSIVAADLKVIPMGSYIYCSQRNMVYKVGDTGSAIVGNRLDLWKQPPKTMKDDYSEVWIMPTWFGTAINLVLIPWI